MNKTIHLCCFLFVAGELIHTQQADFPKLTGLYLGQKPPGNIPQIFGPDFISTESNYECCRAVSSDAKDIFFVRNTDLGEKIFRTTETENGWTKPVPVTYTDLAFQYSPFISPQGDLLLFMSGKTNPKKSNTNSLPEIWVLKRENNDWVSPQSLGYLIGGAAPFYITMSKSGTLYFDCLGRDGVYRSQRTDGKYSLVERLPGEINGF